MPSIGGWAWGLGWGVSHIRTGPGSPPPPPGVCQGAWGGVRQARRNQAWLGPTEPRTERSRFLLTSGREWGKYYRVVHFIGLNLNNTRNPRRALAARLGEGVTPNAAFAMAHRVDPFEVCVCV